MNLKLSRDNHENWKNHPKEKKNKPNLLLKAKKN